MYTSSPTSYKDLERHAYMKDDRKSTIPHEWKTINRGYLLFLGEYQIYIIECVENISNFTSASMRTHNLPSC